MTQVWSQTFSFAIASLGTDVLELEVLRYAEVSKETYLYGKRGLLTLAYLRYAIDVVHIQ